MRNAIPVLAAFAGLIVSSAALAQTDTDTKDFSVIGNVPAMCVGGTLDGGDNIFDLGVLVDTATGLLRNDLSADDKVLTGSFCSTRSTIEVEATPLLAQSYAGDPPASFSKSVNYVATASGWTTNPAVYDTGAQSNPNAVQSRSTPFTGDITVGLSNFSTVGGNALLLVADPEYQGTVTVTLTVAD